MIPSDALLLTADEAASLLRCSRSTIWKLIWTGQIPHLRVGTKSVRIARSTLDRWIAENESREAT